MPFLVDSVTNELTRQGRGIHVVIHPQVVVRRDVTGKLIEVSHRAARRRPAARRAHRVLDPRRVRPGDRPRRPEADHRRPAARPVRRPRGRRGLEQDAGRGRAHRRRAGPASPIADLREQEFEEARELLRWLADDHFTFLGYREYELRGDDSLAAVPGTGLGILRSDPHHAEDDSHPVSPSFERLPADARAKAREHKLLVLTKANSRATVHRPSYLDYVGVKKFDENGEVVGERRFLGLFSSAAYTESVRRVPVVRRKVDEVLEVAGFSPNSHDGRDLLQILETYPRDELFQTPVRRAPADRHLRALPPGAPSAAALPAPGRVRALLLRARLPPPRPLHHRRAAADHRHPEGGARRYQRRLHRLEHRVDPLPAALRRPGPAGHRAAAAQRPGQGAHRGAARRGRPLLGRRLRRRAERRTRRGARRRAAAPLLQRLPRGLQGRPHPALRGRRPRPHRTAHRGQQLLAEPVRAGRRRPRASAGSRSTARARPSPCPPSCRSSAGSASRSWTSGRTSCAAPTAASPGSTTSACACPRRRAAPGTISATTPASGSRRPSPRPGPARRRTTASTPSC